MTAKISLRLLLTFFLVMQILLIAGLVAYISFLNGQAAVNTVAAEYRNSLSERIKQHLITFLDVPPKLNQNNANLIRSGAIDANDGTALQSYFLSQLELHPSITSIYFGNEKGGIVGSGREGAGGFFYIYNTPDFKAGTFEKYSFDTGENEKTILAQVPNFDARTRPWYKNAIQIKTFVWNDIYVLITGQDMALATSTPVYDEQQNLIGVMSVDIFLSHLSKYLQQMEEIGNGESFIIERSGLLVATSTNEPLYKELDADGKPERVDVHLSTTPIIHDAADALTAQYGDYSKIQTDGTIEFDMNGDRQFLQVSPLHDEYGIDWLIVVVSPESAFMGQIEENNHWTMTIILIAVIASIGLSLWTAHKIIRPISLLADSMDAITKKEWDGAVTSHTRIKELNELSLAFNLMRETLKKTMKQLSDEVHERQQAQMLMHESQDRYRTLVENMPIGVLRIGIDGILIAANPAFRFMFGLRTGDTSTVSSRELFVDSEKIAILTRDLVSKGILKNVEVECKKKDGTTFWGSLIIRSVVDDNGEVIHFDGTIQDVTEQKKTAETLQYLATHDILTSIPNRAFFENQLSQAITLAKYRGTGLAVLFIDLDDFKIVNDTFGHLKGDRLLQLVAQRISSCVRVSDMVARFGGDEFAIFLDGLSRDMNIRPILEKIMAALSQPFYMEGREVYVTASIGASVFPEDGDDLETLIQNADHAMYRSKITGKNNYNFSQSD